MASTTPTGDPIRRGSRNRSTSRGRNPPSRPTTPLRPVSRTSLRDSSGANVSSPLDALEPAFAELSDGMVDLEANFMHLQLMHESLARFSESFAAFLYGMNMNAFCVDFPEAPIPESFKRARQAEQLNENLKSSMNQPEPEIEATFLTTDSFVENPPSSKAPSKFSTPAPPSKAGRGGSAKGATAGRGSRGTTRGSGLARATSRGRGR
ncbi:hypothetical protein NA57DRAFT_55978 [Rhizodiscina lignyota]|uniref:DASH complex subunit DAM1 n=1 Tax=Rhizodiscina lignyota TaxID=1504668 RepID=A0A9P4M754_9PEZI|nr:hypothetical protein NA57DRAFT_55978 [Rhizodiscina lignyota]